MAIVFSWVGPEGGGVIGVIDLRMDLVGPFVGFFVRRLFEIIEREEFDIGDLFARRVCFEVVATVDGAFETVQVFGHIGIEIIVFGFAIAMVPVCIGVQD